MEAHCNNVEVYFAFPITMNNLKKGVDLQMRSEFTIASARLTHTSIETCEKMILGTVLKRLQPQYN